MCLTADGTYHPSGFVKLIEQDTVQQCWSQYVLSENVSINNNSIKIPIWLMSDMLSDFTDYNLCQKSECLHNDRTALAPSPLHSSYIAAELAQSQKVLLGLSKLAAKLPQSAQSRSGSQRGVQRRRIGAESKGEHFAQCCCTFPARPPQLPWAALKVSWPMSWPRMPHQQWAQPAVPIMYISMMKPSKISNAILLCSGGKKFFAQNFVHDISFRLRLKCIHSPYPQLQTLTVDWCRGRPPPA